MTALTPQTVESRRHGFSHQALLYAGDDEFVDGTLPFVRAGLEADEPTMVVVNATKLGLLKEALNGDGRHVQFADMAEVGLNPARIIPAWRAFLDASEGRAIRGIGEPVWAGLSADQIAECQRHEALLNVAFAGGEDFQLLCPYDVEALEPAIIDETHRSHPQLRHGTRESESDAYLGLEAFSAPFHDALPEPPAEAERLHVDGASLGSLRAAVRRFAADAGAVGRLADDLLVGVNELASNSVRHGGGAGDVRLWRQGDELVCEVRDHGQLDIPLVGRVRPDPLQVDGRGLWLTNQLCDLVQIRSGAGGTVVRLHMRQPSSDASAPADGSAPR
jgi:anti-sigma regulatory factor (Ser/Thr protein kinase)